MSVRKIALTILRRCLRGFRKALEEFQPQKRAESSHTENTTPSYPSHNPSPVSRPFSGLTHLPQAVLKPRSTKTLRWPPSPFQMLQVQLLALLQEWEASPAGMLPLTESLLSTSPRVANADCQPHDLEQNAVRIYERVFRLSPWRWEDPC